MTVREAASLIDHLAPFDSAESFDNVGLLIGDAAQEVTGIVFGLDITEPLLEQALQTGSNLIITHHPFIFNPIRRLISPSPQYRMLSTILSNHFSVIAAHTNWDKAAGGVADTLAACLSLEDTVSVDDYLRVGKLPYPMGQEEFAAYVAKRLHVEPRVYGSRSEIRSVGVGPGMLGEAAAYCETDALVTGEYKHHQLLEGTARGLLLVCAEHYSTEFPGLVRLMECFAPFAGQKNIKTYLHTDPPFSGVYR